MFGKFRFVDVYISLIWCVNYIVFLNIGIWFIRVIVIDVIVFFGVICFVYILVFIFVFYIGVMSVGFCYVWMKMDVIIFVYVVLCVVICIVVLFGC